jgi:hypothetical protein
MVAYLLRKHKVLRSNPSPSGKKKYNSYVSSDSQDRKNYLGLIHSSGNISCQQILYLLLANMKQLTHLTSTSHSGHTNIWANSIITPVLPDQNQFQKNPEHLLFFPNWWASLSSVLITWNHGMPLWDSEVALFNLELSLSLSLSLTHTHTHTHTHTLLC